jgi:23S rRNA U2552 (ribose-2'-O)-methylase RlmE/FtsJ
MVYKNSVINTISMKFESKSKNYSKSQKINKNKSKVKSTNKSKSLSKLSDKTYRKIDKKMDDRISLFRPSIVNNYDIKINDKDDIKYSWNIKKGKKEEIFYNYPVDILIENIYHLQKLMNYIAETNNITIKNNDIYPNKVLEKFYYLKKSYKQYSPLGEMIRTEYIKRNNIELKPFPDSYVKTKGNNNLNVVSSILYHRFIYHYMTVQYMYIIDKYNLLPIKYKDDFKVLNICHHLGFVEASIYRYIGETHKQILNDMFQSQLLVFVFNGEYKDYDVVSMSKIYGYDNLDKINNIWSLEELDNKIEEHSGKDLCFVDSHILLADYGVIRTNYNHMLMLANLILAMGTLNKNGNMLMSMAGLSTKFSQDLLFIVSRYFVDVEIFKTEIQEPHYNSIFVIAKGFQTKENENFLVDMQNMKELYKDMYNNDNTGGFKYVPNEPKVEKKLEIEHIKSDYVYYNSLLDVENSVVYPQINTFIQIKLTNYNDFISNLDFYYKNILNDKEKHNRIQMLHTHKSIQLANYLGLRINPLLDINNIQTDLVNDIYRNLYGIDNTVYYRFRLYEYSLKIGKPSLHVSNRYLLEQVLRMENATQVFDTRHIENYDKLKKHLRFYEKSLNILLMERFNTGVPIKRGKIVTHPSRAWIKMYEIAEVTKLIPKKSDKYKSLCFCEAPGNFILAINHFIKTKTEIKKFDWIAQSYNPNTKSGRDFHVLGDDYDLMKKYPEKWDFGPKNTGDVTDSDNIKYYGTVYNDVDLLTSDCGTDWSGDDLISSKLMYGQLLFILNNLPKGKNFVIKYYIPFIHYPAQLALFYIIYQSFKEVSFYKPLQNAWSHEFYLIGKKYKGLSGEQLEPLFEIMDNYNPYMSPIDLNKLPEEFMKQIEKVSKDVVDRFVFYIERYIYYLDIIENGKKPNFDVVDKHIKLRNEEWISEFKIKKISDKDKM